MHIIYRCAECGSDEVEIHIWHAINKPAEVVDADDVSNALCNGDTWCPECLLNAVDFDEEQTELETL